MDWAEESSEADLSLDQKEQAGDPAHQNGSCERVVTVVGRNHGHRLKVSESDILDGLDHTYELKGASPHGHTLTLSAKELHKIARGEVLRRKTEFGAGHRHRILVRCEPLVLPPDRVSVCEAVVAGKDGHNLIIPESHVRGGKDQSYDVQGVSGHTHSLTITAAQFERLIRGELLDIKTSLEMDHYHHTYIRYRGTP